MPSDIILNTPTCPEITATPKANKELAQGLKVEKSLKMEEKEKS